MSPVVWLVAETSIYLTGTMLAINYVDRIDARWGYRGRVILMAAVLLGGAFSVGLGIVVSMAAG